VWGKFKSEEMGAVETTIMVHLPEAVREAGG
jgi:hypothetical protein